MRANAKKRKQAASVLAGASLLMSGCGLAAGSVMDTEDAVPPVTEVQPAPADAVEREAPEGLAPREEKTLIKVSDVSGEFAFNQDVLTPDDGTFNLYGTVMTGVCAVPGFELEDNGSSYYINVGGRIKESYTVNVAELAQKRGESRIMKCSCAMSPQAVTNARVTGIPLSAVLELAQMDEAVNCVTVYGADGYGIPMPLTYALEKEAMLVYQVNGHDLSEEAGGAVQLWMPEAVARYFTRSVVNIELSAEAAEPEILEAEPAYRAKINIMNYADDVEFAAGELITLEGYADDYDVAIESVEFSLDGGETWTVCKTEGASAKQWVYWQFSFAVSEPGDYEMMVRARTADGRESPLASTLAFHVTGETAVQ